MKKGALLLALIITTSAYSQTDKQITAVSEETCECLNTKDLKGSSMDQVQMELGICMIAAMGKNGIEIDINNPAGIERIGEQVGMKLALTCPSFLEFMGAYANDDPEGFQELIEDHDSPFIQQSKSSGTALAVSSNEFVTLKIQNETGRKETFYWFEYFEGSELLENGGAKILTKKVSIEYKTVEYYSPKLEDYTDVKVITSLSID